MKTFSILTFTTFMICLSVKMYSNNTNKLLNMSLTQETPEDLFEIAPEKARALLDTLYAVTFAQEITEQQKFERPIANYEQVMDVKVQEKNQGKEVLESMRKVLVASFMLAEDNIDKIYELQSELRSKNEEYNQLSKNLEIWSPDFIFYLVIKEGYSFEGLDNINGIRELGFSTDQIIKMKRSSRSNNFMLEILLYKSAIDDDEYNQSLAIIEDKDEFNTEVNGEFESNNYENSENHREVANYSSDEEGEMSEYREQAYEVDLEPKLLEESYDQEELEEIKYGYESSEDYN